jgi:UDP-GlcNAc:undecaprenyl-phosphate/decaprenyl-phosphate GlcNAc-1-phosphate transferase
MAPPLFVGVFVLSAGMVLLLTPVVIRLGLRWRLVAEPGGRRRHQGRVVRIGALALFPSFAVATLVSLAIPRSDPLEPIRLAGILLGLAMVTLLGLVDDRNRLPAWAQLLGLAAAALTAIAFKVFIEIFNNPLTDGQIKVDWYLMLPLTLFWLVGMPSTMNFLDGLDGLATGVTGISALVLFVHMLRLGQYSVAILPLALAGCCAGFLRYNFYPARIFLGGGAYVLGYALGALSIVAGAKVASALLVLWVPIIDVAWQIYRRWRRHQSPALGDRGHLHFRLLDMGWPQSRIVLVYYSITALLGVVALVVSSRLLKVAVLAVIGLAVLVLLALLTRISGDRTQSGE